VADTLRPAPDLFSELAPRVEDEEQRLLLRALLDRLAEGGGPAVREEVRERLRAILAEGA
jgi:hypothetical protein